jgi:hypothetical protein
VPVLQPRVMYLLFVQPYRPVIWSNKPGCVSECGQATPNAGHCTLVAIKHRIAELVLITRNVAGLHTWQMGSYYVVELYSSLFRMKCFKRGQHVKNKPESADISPRCLSILWWIATALWWVWLGKYAGERVTGSRMGCRERRNFSASIHRHWLVPPPICRLLR